MFCFQSSYGFGPATGSVANGLFHLPPLPLNAEERKADSSAGVVSNVTSRAWRSAAPYAFILLGLSLDFWLVFARGPAADPPPDAGLLVSTMLPLY